MDLADGFLSVISLSFFIFPIGLLRKILTERTWFVSRIADDHQIHRITWLTAESAAGVTLVVISDQLTVL